MREVYPNIQLNCYWYPPWKTGALRRSWPLLLAPDFSKLFWRADSSEGRLADGLATENCFFCNTRTHRRSLLLALPGTWRRSTTARETKLFMLRHILHIPYLNDIRDADSRSGCSLTNSWWGNCFGTEPTLPCIFHRFPPWCNFFAARLQIGNYRASLYTDSSPRVKPSIVSNSICGSESSVQHNDPSLREKASLCE